MLKGKLYKCPVYPLLIYPTKEMALTRPGVNPTAGSEVARFWSKELNCQVLHSDPGEIFMLLEKDHIFGCCHVLFGDKQGWIICRNWMGIKEARNEV